MLILHSEPCYSSSNSFALEASGGDTMMKCIVATYLMLSVLCLEATWVVSSIQNTSDISLKQAARTNRKKQDVTVQSVTKTLHSSQNSTTILLQKEASFGSSGNCKIKGVTGLGKSVTISFLGNPTNRVANGRADRDLTATDVVKSGSRRAASDIKTANMARVILTTQDGDEQLLAFSGYEKDGQKFVLHISGKKQKYHGVLEKLD